MRKLTIMLLSLLVVMALVLAGCGGGDDDKDESSGAAAEPTQEMVEESESDTEDAVAQDTASEDATTDDAAAEDTVEIALKITGSVANEMAWTEDEVRAMETMESASTNSKGETDTYTGVSLNALLEQAAPAEDATTLTLIGETEADVSLADVLACDNCIISFRNKGGFSAVLPDFSKDAQVKGVTEVIVK